MSQTASDFMCSKGTLRISMPICLSLSIRFLRLGPGSHVGHLKNTFKTGNIWTTKTWTARNNFLEVCLPMNAWVPVSSAADANDSGIPIKWSFADLGDMPYDAPRIASPAALHNAMRGVHKYKLGWKYTAAYPVDSYYCCLIIVRGASWWTGVRVV